MTYVDEWLKKYPSFQNFKKLMDRGRLSKNTVDSYIKGIKTFIHVLKLKDPEKTLTILRESENVEEILDNFIETYSNKVEAGTCARVMKGVKRWLVLNHVDVNWIDVIIPVVQIQEEDRAPTRDEILQFLNVCKLRDRAMILCMISSGLRIGTLLTLTFEDVNFDYSDVARVMVRRAPGRKLKKRKFFITFISPEAKKLLLEYKAYREREGEKITPQSPLFTSGNRKEMGKFINRNYYSGVRWGRLLRKTGLAEKSQKWFVLHLHTLRKFFKTQCINAGVKSSYHQFWMGHSGAYLEDSYFRGEENKHLEEYRKTLPYVTIIEKPAVSEEERRIQATYDNLRLAGFSEDEIEDLKNQRGKTWTTPRHLIGIARSKRTPKLSEEEKAELRRKLEKAKTETNGGNCTNGHNCQQIVTEEELPSLLSQGWRVSAVLPSGKVVVESLVI